MTVDESLFEVLESLGCVRAEHLESVAEVLYERLVGVKELVRLVFVRPVLS